MRPFLALLLALLLAGCATPPSPPPPRPLLHDDAFAPPTAPVDATQALALSPELRHFIHRDLAPRVRAAGGRQRALVEAMYARAQLRLDYDTERTRTASEAFASRSGNCLSLVLLTAAVARELGLDVRYHRAVIDETWSRDGDLVFLNGHVNISLTRSRLNERTGFDAEHSLTVDFLPPEELRGLRTVEVPESTVLGMFLNNRAAESLARGERDQAYWWAREALLQAPAFLPAYNTLAVVYLQHGRAAEAEAALRHLLQLDPRHRQGLSNLSLALRRQQRGPEADEIARRLAAMEARPPFEDLQRGVQALQRGHARVAREWFERELQRDPDYHETHYWMGVASLHLGDEAAARRHLALALKHSLSRRQQGLYSAKLDALNAHRLR